MVGKIFINYRRDDEGGFTRALYQSLTNEFAPDDLFVDVGGQIKLGDDFVKVIDDKVAATDVMLVVIGRRWAELLKGDPSDFVAIEIKAAFDHGKRVIPVFVEGAKMPPAEALPEAIQQLARRQGTGIRLERFDDDCQNLFARMKEALAAADHERAARTEAEHKGLSAELIRKAEELASWDFVKDRGDTRDLRDHLARFPGGVTERFARAQLHDLVWAGLGSTPRLDDLLAYVEEFQKGTNVKAVKARLAELGATLAGKKIAVMVESEYIPHEITTYQKRFASYGATVEFVSRLWGQTRQMFCSTVQPGLCDQLQWLDVVRDFDSVRLDDYAAIIVPANYVSVRLRWSSREDIDMNNAAEVARDAPAVRFFQRAMENPKIIKGAAGHGLWLLTPSPDLLAGRKVICSKVVLADVVNAGGVYTPCPPGTPTDQQVVVDGDLVTNSSWSSTAALVDAIKDLIVNLPTLGTPLGKSPQ